VLTTVSSYKNPQLKKLNYRERVYEEREEEENKTRKLMKRKEIKTDIYLGHCKKYQNAMALFPFTRKFTSRWQSKSCQQAV